MGFGTGMWHMPHKTECEKLWWDNQSSRENNPDMQKHMLFNPNQKIGGQAMIRVCKVDSGKYGAAKKHPFRDGTICGYGSTMEDALESLDGWVKVAYLGLVVGGLAKMSEDMY